MIALFAGTAATNASAKPPETVERSEIPRLQSVHITMSDGVKIAADIWLPKNLKPDQKVPTLLRSTRYWRAPEMTSSKLKNDDNYKEANPLNEAGYALVIIDVRGTGASFGKRQYILDLEEIQDLGEVVNWIAEQSWSNEKVGAFGVSYDGTTAELTAVHHPSALKAVAPLYADFSSFEHLVHPGNLALGFYMEDWANYVWQLDNNDICGALQEKGIGCEILKMFSKGVKPVDNDTDGKLLALAVKDHQQNARDSERGLEFHDDPYGNGPSGSVLLANPAGHMEALESSGIAYFSRVGWLDAATVAGVLSRYNTLSNPQKVVIGALSHAGSHDTDPFKPKKTKPTPTEQQQVDNFIAYFDHYLKPQTTLPPLASSVTYVTMGSGKWHTTPVWPPVGFKDTSYYFSPNNTLTTQRPKGGDKAPDTNEDTYKVDFSATTGLKNRWHGNASNDDIVYPNRKKEDEKLLTYTTKPVTQDTEITGHPLVSLFVRSTHKDGAFFVYLEDVAPNGRVTYITEGQLRGVSRKVSDEIPIYHYYGPYRTFSRADACDMVPGEVTELTFDLWPTSVLIKKGHSIRVAIAGADVGNFDQYPKGEGDVTLTLERNSIYASKIVLPVAIPSK